uniref:Peptidase S1 domain-containing protein n=1 Tax=Anopheles funestus TaxID=62324 RepID=A0A1Y9HDR9_ANOFN
MCVTFVRFLLLFGLLGAVSQTNGEERRLTCGRRRVKSVYLIHNGIDAKAGHWPWHATVSHQKVGRLDYACGGAVLDENTVLTAAHCVHTERGLLAAKRILVHVGRIQLKEESEFTKIHTVQEVIVHPRFSRSSSMNDIALLKLSTNITMTKYVQPVCLWTMDSNQELIVGRNGTVVGFGLNEHDVVSNQLKQALIGVVDPLTCIASDRAVFGTHLTSDMYCGKGQTGVSACNGDSGGGMFFEVGGKWFVRGLVSFTPLRGNTGLCDPLKYTVYTDVAKYLEWIVQYVDPQVLSFESDVLEIDYEEKLRLFNFNTCGVKSSTFVEDGTNWTLPWLGFVRARKEFKSRCVVTLISEWYAVGPAFCFENDGVEAFVLVGNGKDNPSSECFDRNGTTRCTEPTQTLRIQRVIIHPQFGTHSSADNIALIEFLNPADITQPNVQPICLPVTSELRPNPKINLHVAYISIANGAYKNVPVTLLDSADCMRQYADRNITLQLLDKRICAKISNAPDLQDCDQLIAGSPLQETIMLRTKERYFLRGFELFGAACYSQAPPVYNNIEPYVDWILYNMRYNEPDTVDVEVKHSTNSTLSSQWLQLQQEPGNEKLRLFNMSSCGVTVSRMERIGNIVIFPWLAMIVGAEDLEGKHVEVTGIGVLINEWYILTSASAMLQKKSWRSVAFGLYNSILQAQCVGDDCLSYHEAAIKSITIHPAYSKDPRNHNIALIELELPANFTKSHISPICLPFLRDLHKRKPLNLVVSSDEEIDIRHKRLTELNATVCQRQLAQEGFLTSAKTVPWCAVDSNQRGQAQLELNGGAPLQALLQFDEQTLYFLRGINLRNHLPNELPYLPELFTNVDRFLDWILDSMKVKELNVTFPYATERTKSRRVNVLPIRNTSKRTQVNFSNCGIIPTTQNGTFIPWMGYLSSNEIFLNASKDSRCAVTLVNEWYAVGLAFCFPSSSSKNYSVLFGVNSVETPMECTETDGSNSCLYPTQQIPVDKIIIHPHYNSSSYHGDIALVKLARPVDTSQPNVKPICLPLLDEIRSYNTSSLVAVSENEPGSLYLISRIDGRDINSTECQKRWDDILIQYAIENGKICIMLEIAPNNECYDLLRGSSLHTIQRINSAERHFLRGIQQFKPKMCTLNIPVVYVETDLYLDWILDNMEDSSYPLGLSYDLRKQLIFASK